MASELVWQLKTGAWSLSVVAPKDVRFYQPRASEGDRKGDLLEADGASVFTS